MSKKYSSRATKMVLASLLAASMTVPSFASAEVGGTVTRTAETTEVTTTSAEVKKETVIDFTLSPADSPAARFIKGPWTIVSTPGGTFLDPKLDESTAKVITEITVDGKSVMSSRGIYIPYSEEKTELELSITTSFSPNPTVVTVKLDPNTIREVEIKEEVEVVEQPTTEDSANVVAVSSLPDGMYNVKMQMLKEDKTGTSGAGRNFFEDAILKVVDGKAVVELFVSTNHHMIVSYDAMVDGKLVPAEVTTKTKDGYVKSITVPVENIGATEEGLIKVDYTSVMPTMGITPHKIYLQLDADSLATTGSIFTYKPGTNEGSIMNGTYLNPAASYKAVEGGYEVTVTFPKGKYVVDFKVEGKEAELVQGVTETNPASVYKFVVADISDRIPATIHINVNEPAAGVVYNSNHSIEFQLTGKAVQPFGDIENSWANGYIEELYAKGIFAVNNQFYPTNKTERYQFALMLQRALKLEVPATTTFTDIQKYDAETVSAVKALSNFGVINGVNAEKTLFAPNGEISRQDTAIMIYRLLEKKGFKANEEATISFADVKDASNGSAYDKEAYKAITQLNALKIMNGKSEASFDPKGTLTRAEMAKVLSVTLEVLEGLK